MNKFECPVCKTVFEEDDENNTAPFCSQNCRQIFANQHKVQLEKTYINQAIRNQIDKISKEPTTPMNIKRLTILKNYLKSKRNGSKSSN